MGGFSIIEVKSTYKLGKNGTDSQGQKLALRTPFNDKPVFALDGVPSRLDLTKNLVVAQRSFWRQAKRSVRRRNSGEGEKNE